MRLMILENKKLRTVLPVEGAMLSIGSSPQCGVHLPDPRISAEQAKLVRDEEGAWWLEVMDTSVPTCLNRAVQKGRAKLRHADEVEVGAFSIRLFMEHKTPEELRRERMVALTKAHGESLPLGTIAKKFDHLVNLQKDQLVELTILSMRVSQFESIRDALLPILRAMLRVLGARRAWVGVRPLDRDEFAWTLGLNDQGHMCDRPTFCVTMESRCLVQGQYLCCPDAPPPEVRSAMSAPMPCAAGNLGMLYVENNAGDPAFGEEALDTFSAMAACVAVPLETIIRKSAAKRLAVSSSEQTVARATQDAVTPKALPQWNELQVAGYRHMGSARCCDYYDVVQLPDKTCALIVARLSVDGMAVARYLAEVRAAFRSAALHCDAPHLFARSLNWLLAAGDSRHSVDLATAWISPSTGKVNYCVAGEGVYIGVILPNGTCEKLEPKRGESIGKAKNLTLELQSLELGHGYTLALATAGIHGAVSAEGETFGLSGLEEALCDALGNSPGQVLNDLAADFSEFLQGGNCPDDVSVVLARRT